MEAPMQTALTYFNDSYQFSCSAKILFSGRDETGWYIILDQTVFYPQGGGQPSDVGTLEVAGQILSIQAVKWVGQEVRHYSSNEQEPANLVDQQALITIDEARRVQNNRFHSAGHLLSHVLEKCYPRWKAFKGHHYPESAYVEFMCNDASPDIVNLELINREINNINNEDLPVSGFIVSPERLKELCPTATHHVNSNLPIRVVSIGKFPLQPCGGTHVKTLRELAGLTTTKQKLKGNVLRISYTM